MTAQAKKKAQKKEQKNSRPAKSEEVKDQEFLVALEKFFDKHNRNLSAIPALRFNPQTNGFDIVVNTGVHRRSVE